MDGENKKNNNHSSVNSICLQCDALMDERGIANPNELSVWERKKKQKVGSKYIYI